MRFGFGVDILYLSIVAPALTSCIFILPNKAWEFCSRSSTVEMQRQKLENEIHRWYLLCGSWKQEGKWKENDTKDGWDGNQETHCDQIAAFSSLMSPCFQEPEFCFFSCKKIVWKQNELEMCLPTFSK